MNCWTITLRDYLKDEICEDFTNKIQKMKNKLDDDYKKIIEKLE
jgi:multimeric flavodoxin WrbA